MRPLLARLLTPTGFALAGLCFLLPFATVSCGAPGGYGRGTAGATSTYTGFDLVTGGAPDVRPADHLRPPAQWRKDRLPPQPLAIVTLLLLIGGVTAPLLMGRRRIRFPIAAGIALSAVAFLLANQAAVEAQLRGWLAEQVGSFPSGQRAADFVNTGGGFAVCLIVLCGLILGNLIGWVRRPRPARATPKPFESRRVLRARAEARAAQRIKARDQAVAPGPGRRTDGSAGPAETVRDDLAPPEAAGPSGSTTLTPPSVDPWPGAPL